MTRLAALALILLLTGCYKTVDTACTAFKPITYDAIADTAETRTQVREFNAAWVAICGS